MLLLSMQLYFKGATLPIRKSFYLAAFLTATVSILTFAEPAGAQVFTRDPQAGGFGGGQAGGQAGGQRGMPDPSKIMRLDRDGDGALSLEEVPERMRERFDMIDGDGDGLIKEAELQSFFDRIKQLREQGGGQGGFGQGGGFGKRPGNVTPQSAPAPNGSESDAGATAKPYVPSFFSRFSTEQYEGSVKDIDYTDGVAPDDERRKLDIYPTTHANGAAPVMVMIHGGGWQIGRKDTNDLLKNKVPYFDREGWVFTSINYRLVPNATPAEQAHDVATALVWLRDHIAEHGGDPAQIHIMGHSAGAHLAALTAIDPQYLHAVGADTGLIRSVTLLDGAGYNLLEHQPTNFIIRKMYNDAFGEELEARIPVSPIHQIKAGASIPPFLITYVERTRSPEASEELATALREAGFSAETYQAPEGYDHGSINGDFGATDDPVSKRVMEFLNQAKSS
ncbi:MAG TPA: hypothetical protein DFI00_10070 [Rhodospirillaceae bacterium]|nr:hypothetical protein [Alphaproteobacteria bacterium]MBN52318.1 hypothetical protein [Alphaproteobacteria bacterium]OUT41120.1 MAG: hypothetical protein CBB62_01800 [Micavibrio sp. TMED2]HCI47627.1 hypothetical protein [Rhodospirillaceae bacterium]|tara:strand:- start:24 stop:1373 length:1350 start_codon:yes stop_codon:yes gene_type:complete